MITGTITKEFRDWNANMEREMYKTRPFSTALRRYRFDNCVHKYCYSPFPRPGRSLYTVSCHHYRCKPSCTTKQNTNHTETRFVGNETDNTSFYGGREQTDWTNGIYWVMNEWREGRAEIGLPLYFFLPIQYINANVLADIGVDFVITRIYIYKQEQKLKIPCHSLRLLASEFKNE